MTITTGDSPHLAFTPGQLTNLTGGVYEVQRGPAAPSFLEVPLAPAGAYADTCMLCRNPLP